MTLGTEDHLDDLIVMREEGLRCLQVALGKGDKPALMTWQTCISRIEALITRRSANDSEPFIS
jgi:hypothetical protein